MPLVSVVIPTYNRTPVVLRAINSALSQTLTDIEVLVVDDGSTDATRTLVENLDDDRLRLLSHETNKGVSAARNTGIKAARGEFVAFLDSDDEWLPTKLLKQVQRLIDESEMWIGTYCDWHSVYEEQNFITRVMEVLYRPKPIDKRGGRKALMVDVLQMYNHVCGGSTLLVRRDELEAIGGFDESLPDHEDWDLVLRLLRRGKIAFVDEPLVVLYRSGRPSVDQLEQTKGRYLTRFQPEIEAFEAQGYKITTIHHLHLAKTFYRHGNFRKGTFYLFKARIRSPIEYIKLLYYILEGAREKLIEAL